MSSISDKHIYMEVTNNMNSRYIGMPVTQGIPFPEGYIKSIDQLQLVDGETLLPHQAEVLAQWPDQSIKWLLLDYKVDCGAVEQKKIMLRIGENNSAVTKGALIAKETEKELNVKNNLIDFSLSKHNFHPIGRLVVLGKEVVGEEEGKKSDLIAVDNLNKIYRASLAPSVIMCIEKNGPFHTVIKVTGKHTSQEGESFLDFLLRYHFYANSALIKIEHTFINAQEPEEGVIANGIRGEFFHDFGRDATHIVKHIYNKNQSGYNSFPRYKE